MSFSLLEIDHAIDLLAAKYADAERAKDESLKRQIRTEYEALDLLRLVAMNKDDAIMIRRLESSIETVESAIHRLQNHRLQLGWHDFAQQIGVKAEESSDGDDGRIEAKKPLLSSKDTESIDGALATLVALYRDTTIEFPELKSISLAQWLLESGHGRSGLARIHNNFAGMKWRTAMKPFARRILYNAHDGKGYYCNFHDQENFIEGYWAFLERSPYNGWRDHTDNGEAFIEFIGPIWAEDPGYIEKVLDLVDEAEALLVDNHLIGEVEADAGDEEIADDDAATPGTLLPGRPGIHLDPPGKIAIGTDGLEIIYKGVDTCPYGISATRNKKPFRGFILHHTKPGKDAQWYVDYQIRGDSARGGHFGYHFFISLDGKIYQGAPLTKRTNHISSKKAVRNAVGSHLRNTNSIGITCVGAGKPSGFDPTQAQVETVRRLVFPLCDVFDISFTDVFGHGEIQTNRMRSEGASLARDIRDW